jgi:hypothetical protein
MASLAWTRDLIMLAFALLLLVITGIRLSGSGITLMPLAGDLALMPMMLILIATISMMWALRMWSTISRRRALLCILVSLSASWVTALACLQGMARREGVFLRTSKTGSSHHRLRTALRLARWETLFAVLLYTAAGFLAASAHPPLLLILFIAVQGSVYACTPIASLWNVRAQAVPAPEFRRRFEEGRLRHTRRVRPSLTMAGRVGAVVLAVVVGGATAAIVAPDRLVPVGVVGHVGVTTPGRTPAAGVRPSTGAAAAPTTGTGRPVNSATPAR